MTKRLLLRLNSTICFLKNRHSCQPILSGVLNRYLSKRPTTENEERSGDSVVKKIERMPCSVETKLDQPRSYDTDLLRDSSDDDELNAQKWKVELAWLSKAVEPALQLFKWASSSGSDEKWPTPSTTRSPGQILNDLQRSKISIQDWSLSDVTVGLYLIYLSQAGTVEDVKGDQILSDIIVQELIYHLELAKGAYKDGPTALARHSMLRERNILKFVKDSSVMRPGYYIGIDTRKKLVVFGIRGTHTVYDLITDLASTSDQNLSSEGFSTHFGTAEAARWYLRHEIGTIRKCLEKHKGFRLRLVGHSLGGAAAALLAIMLREKSKKELGFSPEIVSAVGFGTPPCLSREVAESCAGYVSTVVLQDDIIPRLSAASLARLRNEILETDWMAILHKEDWKGIVDIVTNAKLVVSSIQDVTRKLVDYARFKSDASDTSRSPARCPIPCTEASAAAKQDIHVPEELYIPGTLYYLKRQVDDINGSAKCKESYTLWRRHPGEHFHRILLSGNFISDHKCESHYYALRDVLKSLPFEDDRVYF